MPADFGSALSMTLKYEGEYSNNPDDPGRETYRGISRRYHPNWHGWTILDAGDRHSPDLLHAASDFYFDEFWKPLNLGSFKSQHLATAIFDSAVLFGLSQPALWLQRGLNALNKRGTLWDDLQVDGHIGEKTIAAENAAHHVAFDLSVMRLVVGQRIYQHLVNTEENPQLETFMYGWIIRANALLKG